MYYYLTYDSYFIKMCSLQNAECVQKFVRCKIRYNMDPTTPLSIGMLHTLGTITYTFLIRHFSLNLLGIAYS